MVTSCVSRERAVLRIAAVCRRARRPTASCTKGSREDKLFCLASCMQGVCNADMLSCALSLLRSLRGLCMSPVRHVSPTRVGSLQPDINVAIVGCGPLVQASSRATHHASRFFPQLHDNPPRTSPGNRRSRPRSSVRAWAKSGECRMNLGQHRRNWVGLVPQLAEFWSDRAKSPQGPNFGLELGRTHPALEEN